VQEEKIGSKAGFETPDRPCHGEKSWRGKALEASQDGRGVEGQCISTKKGRFQPTGLEQIRKRTGGAPPCCGAHSDAYSRERPGNKEKRKERGKSGGALVEDKNIKKKLGIRKDVGTDLFSVECFQSFVKPLWKENFKKGFKSDSKIIRLKIRPEVVWEQGKVRGG